MIVKCVANYCHFLLLVSLLCFVKYANAAQSDSDDLEDETYAESSMKINDPELTDKFSKKSIESVPYSITSEMYSSGYDKLVHESKKKVGKSKERFDDIDYPLDKRVSTSSAIDNEITATTTLSTTSHELLKEQDVQFTTINDDNVPLESVTNQPDIQKQNDIFLDSDSDGYMHNSIMNSVNKVELSEINPTILHDDVWINQRDLENGGVNDVSSSDAQTTSGGNPREVEKFDEPISARAIEKIIDSEFIFEPSNKYQSQQTLDESLAEQDSHSDMGTISFSYNFPQSSKRLPSRSDVSPENEDFLFDDYRSGNANPERYSELEQFVVEPPATQSINEVHSVSSGLSGSDATTSPMEIEQERKFLVNGYKSFDLTVANGTSDALNELDGMAQDSKFVLVKDRGTEKDGQILTNSGPHSDKVLDPNLNKEADTSKDKKENLNSIYTEDLELETNRVDNIDDQLKKTIEPGELNNKENIFEDKPKKNVEIRTASDKQDNLGDKHIKNVEREKNSKFGENLNDTLENSFEFEFSKVSKENLDDIQKKKVEFDSNWDNEDNLGEVLGRDNNGIHCLQDHVFTLAEHGHMNIIVVAPVTTGKTCNSVRRIQS